MTTINIQSIVDRQHVAGRHLRMLLLCSLIMFMDGFDIYVIGQIAPAIAADMGEPASRLTYVFLAQQIGLSIGAFLLSPLADRYGRKPLLIFCMSVFGLLTLASVYARSLDQLAALRCMSGLFLAAVIPNATALLTEFAPSRHRSTFISIAFSGFVAGTMVSALAVIFLLKAYGWQVCFIIGGIVPLLLALPCLFWLDESPLFRFRRTPSDPRIVATLQRYGSKLTAEDLSALRSVAAKPKRDRPGGGLLAIFAAGRLRVTFLLGASFFISLGAVALLASWSPTFFNVRMDVPVERYAQISLFFYAGSLLGTLFVGPLMDRFRPARTLILLSALASGAIASVGVFPFGAVSSIIAFFLWGFSQTAVQAGLNALCAQAYPTEIRSTAVGWAFGLGRIGGIVGPGLGGLAIASALSLQEIFLIAALAPFLVMLFLLDLMRQLGSYPPVNRTDGLQKSAE